MEKLKLHSPDFTQENIAKLAELFPNCITESSDEHGTVKRTIDFDQLRQELSSSIVEGSQERYQLNWPGKREALLTANAPIAKTLRPCREESVNFDSTKNLFIEGDNLDALKLLQETYLNKVKVIYIDPPYNTGNDFIYEDDFAEDVESYLTRSNQKDDAGKRMIVNTDGNGRFHSEWLSMMYSRLKLARNLLRDDGVILISIDANEVGNLRKMCSEVFGDSNYLQELVWKRHAGGGNDSKHFAIDHEYIMVYAKNKESISRLRMPLDESDKEDYKLTDEYVGTLGKHKTKSFCRMRPDDPRPTLTYDIKAPDGEILRDTWKWEEPRFTKALKDNKVLIRKDRNGKWQVEYKIYINSIADDEGESEERTKVPRSLLTDVERNSEGKKQLREVLGKDNIFNNPKPIGLLSYLLSFSMSSTDIALDFFAGSGTTAHSILALNANDGGARKFIVVQLPEVCDDNSEAFKAGYKTISEITKDRIRRAGKKIKSDNASKDGIGKLDIGFRVLKIDSSNMSDVFYSPDEVKQGDLLAQINNIREGRNEEDLLFQVLLDWGVDLSLPITREVIAGKNVFFVDSNALAACFEVGIDESFVKLLAAKHPLRAVFFDASFASDSVKINIEQIFKLISPTTEIKTI